MHDYLTSLADHLDSNPDEMGPTDSGITATALRTCAALLTEGAAEDAARHLRDLCKRLAHAQVTHALDVAGLNTRAFNEGLRATTTA